MNDLNTRRERGIETLYDVIENDLGILALKEQALEDPGFVHNQYFSDPKVAKRVEQYFSGN